ncbi:MAG TPA: GNAT family N-acetyltransferase [Armatimonadota bacterium]|nr:GNAT family N-acetyltransferase [Armatimonadota bacterium]
MTPPNEPVSIRLARPADAAVITEFNRRIAEETEGKSLDADRLIPGVKRALSDEIDAVYYVAEAGTDVIGQLMITYEWSDWRNGVLWWIQSVYVDEEYRSGGVFRRLFETVERAARAAGAAGLRLYVEKDNHRAQAVYRRLGMDTPGYLVMERLF